MFTLTIHPEASFEYIEALIWYEEQQQGLSLRFEQAIEVKLQAILMNPDAYSFSKRKFREAVVDNFPFVIVYQIQKRKRVVYIASIFHTGRNPRKKFRKAE